MLRVRKGNSKVGTLVSVLRLAGTFTMITLSSISKHVISKHADRHLRSLRTVGYRCLFNNQVWSLGGVTGRS
jgi:hypothetical protein